MSGPRMILEVSYDPANPQHTVARYIRILREQATRLERCAWSLGPGETIEVRDPDTYEIEGTIRHERTPL